MITTSTILAPFLSLLPGKNVQITIDAVPDNSEESLPLLKVSLKIEYGVIHDEQLAWENTLNPQSKTSTQDFTHSK
jgi:hypothetical protein